MMKPLLAETCPDIAGLTYPLFASPKYDGIRCMTTDEGAVSRNLKPIPNKFTRDWVTYLCPAGLDGELIATDEEGNMLPFNEISSAIMSHDEEPYWEFHVFDYVKDWQLKGPVHTWDGFATRLEKLQAVVAKINDPRIKVVEQYLCHSEKDLEWYEEQCLEFGFEGVMTRNMFGTYKFGRSTLREQLLLKVKRFSQDEGTVVGCEELMENTNEATRNAVGALERSSHKAGMVGKNMLGSLIIKPLAAGPVAKADYQWLEKNQHRIDQAIGEHPVMFKIGTGFTEDLRTLLWSDEYRDSLTGQVVTYKHQPSGAKDKPRFPVFIGFRHEDDMSEE